MCAVLVDGERCFFCFLVASGDRGRPRRRRPRRFCIATPLLPTLSSSSSHLPDISCTGAPLCTNLSPATRNEGVESPGAGAGAGARTRSSAGGVGASGWRLAVASDRAASARAVVIERGRMVVEEGWEQARGEAFSLSAAAVGPRIRCLTRAQARPKPPLFPPWPNPSLPPFSPTRASHVRAPQPRQPISFNNAIFPPPPFHFNPPRAPPRMRATRPMP